MTLDLVTVAATAGVVADRTRRVKHHAGDGQTFAKRGRDNERLQHLIDCPHRIAGDDHKRHAELVGQVGDVFLVADWRHQPPAPSTSTTSELSIQ